MYISIWLTAKTAILSTEKTYSEFTRKSLAAGTQPP